MSASRSKWEELEELLLRQIHSEIPGGALRQIWQAFDSRNYQRRTKHAVKAKIKLLRSQPATTPAKELSTLSQQPFEMRYDWSVPELGISIPLHPLIAEARRHAAHIQTVGYASSVSPAARWASILRGADIFGLRCTEADKVALMTYMEYLHR